eukprot:TRINITY_DN42712_c0_g1_i7.p1 TRINITY_DN42712_c0_g1~~TRINITY_DN42712_c0_g1_i7.p1  ORF type:complete len:219 (+),score=-15.59 TRINITY_DN42712_c0_g1_i7:152-808(+)
MLLAGFPRRILRQCAAKILIIKLLKYNSPKNTKSNNHILEIRTNLPGIYKHPNNSYNLKTKSKYIFKKIIVAHHKLPRQNHSVTTNHTFQFFRQHYLQKLQLKPRNFKTTLQTSDVEIVIIHNNNFFFFLIEFKKTLLSTKSQQYQQTRFQIPLSLDQNFLNIITFFTQNLYHTKKYTKYFLKLEFIMYRSKILELYLQFEKQLNSKAASSFSILFKR